jgi:hypothetical protein
LQVIEKTRISSVKHLILRIMEKEEKKKLKYVAPTASVMEFDPGCILSCSAGPGGWSVDGGGSGSTGASSGGWSVDNGGSGTGASTGGWSKDGGGSTGASTDGWSNN